MPDFSIKVPLPDDWYEVAPTKSVEQLKRFYTLKKDVVYRMLRETNIQPLRHAGHGGKPPNPAEVARNRTLRKTEESVALAGREAIEAAVTKLRKRHPNVFRCDITLTERYATAPLRWGDNHGLPNGGAGYYYVEGVGPITEEDAVKLAAQYGENICATRSPPQTKQLTALAL